MPSKSQMYRERRARLERLRNAVTGQWERTEDDGTVTVVRHRINGLLVKVNLDHGVNEVIGTDIPHERAHRSALKNGYRRVLPTVPAGTVVTEQPSELVDEAARQRQAQAARYTPRTPQENRELCEILIQRAEARMRALGLEV